MTRAMVRMVLSAALVCSMAAVSQAQTTSSTEVKSFEIIAVDGNQLVVKLPEGTRELTVADDFRFNVNGQLLSVQQLKPGMKGTATVTTRTTVTPVTVTEVKNGTVVQSGGSSIIVRTDEGFRSFTQGEIDKRGVKIMRAGKPAQVSDFRQGDKLSATIITSMPPKVLTEKEVQATLATAPATGGARPAGAAPAAAAAGGSRPAAAAPAASASASAPAARAAAPAGAASGAPASALPKTASPVPALGLASVLSLAIGLALTVRRRFVR
jgi:hypothetical protein